MSLFSGGNTIAEWKESQLAAYIRRIVGLNVDLPAGLRLTDLVVENLTVSGLLDTGGVQSSATSDAGIVVMFAGGSAPSGYLMCDGAAVSRSTYANLFSAIGVTFGAGDGSTTFNVPDYRQRFPLGKAASGTGSALGGTGGNIDHVHTGPSHTHTYTTGGPSTIAINMAGGGVINVAGENHTHTGTTDAAGTGNTGSANPPFLVVNFIIKT